MRAGIVISVVLWTGIAWVVTGCSVGQQGHVMFAADAQGMRAWGDAMNGLVAQGKARPNATGAYFAHRNMREAEETRRAYAPGLLDGLFTRNNTQEASK